MSEFDLFVPLHYNDGSIIEAKKFQDLQLLLLHEFGGVTYFPQPNQGLWQMDDVIYRDEIVIYRVVTRKARPARKFFAKLKVAMKKTFKQEEIFIVERRVKLG